MASEQEASSEVRFDQIGGETYDFQNLVRSPGYRLRRLEGPVWEARLFMSNVEDELANAPGAKERSPEWQARLLKEVQERCVWRPETAELQAQIEAGYQRYLADAERDDKAGQAGVGDPAGPVERNATPGPVRQDSNAESLSLQQGAPRGATRLRRSLQEVQSLTEPIFASVDAYKLSHASRDRLALKNRSYVYGETLAEPFHDLLERIHAAPGGCFMDLGSGAGRAVLYAALLLEPARAVGVELLPDLVAAARETTQRLRAALAQAGHPETLAQVEWREESFLAFDLSSADLIYIVNAVFDAELMQALTPRLSTLKPGCQVVCIGNPVTSDRLATEAERLRYWTGWGKSFAFVYRAR
jgi:hypothetical protein